MGVLLRILKKNHCRKYVWISQIIFCKLFLFAIPYHARAAEEIASTAYVQGAVSSIISALNEKANLSDLNNYIPLSQKGTGGGIASLDMDGKVPSAQLPDIPQQVNPDWDATSGPSQIINKPDIGTTAGTIAAGDDARFWSIPNAPPSGSPPPGQVFLWFE
ncbi:MAG: hypothetical protein FWG80_01055 [Alphaproteobacteria bacterium]|nr:hypothetical protein [Alphaproteobacteria bacterium]